MWYCGWDGGGTKTEVCVTDEAGNETACRVFGPLNPNGTEREQVLKTVREAVALMEAQPGGAGSCGGVVIGAAGVSNRETAGILTGALHAAGWQGPFRLAGDQEIALAGAIRGHGAILIAGTGSVLCGRDRDGNMFRVGGYGWRIDDGGSGYAIGRDILAAAARAADGRGKPTALTAMIREKLGLGGGDIRNLITWLYAPETGKKEIAALAALLPEALRAGDEAATAVAEKAAEDLAELAVCGWRKSGMTDGELATAGSILQKIPEIRERVRERVNAEWPDIRVTEPRNRPARGAAEMASQSESR